MNRRDFFRTTSLGVAGVALGSIAIEHALEDDVARLERRLAAGEIIRGETIHLTRTLTWPSHGRCGFTGCTISSDELPFFRYPETRGPTSFWVITRNHFILLPAASPDWITYDRARIA